MCLCCRDVTEAFCCLEQVASLDKDPAMTTKSEAYYSFIPTLSIGCREQKESGASTLRLNFSTAFELKHNPAVSGHRPPVENRNPQPFVPFFKDEGLFL